MALVLGELDYWCERRLDLGAWLTFLDDVLVGAYRVEPVIRSDLGRCRALQESYADLSLGVVDASIVTLLERLGETKLATLDRRHFGVVKPSHAPALLLLPE